MKKLFYLFIFYSTFLQSCNKNTSSSDISALRSHYIQEKDSLKYEAVTFLLEYMEEQFSEIPVFRHRLSHKQIDINLDTILSETILKKIIKDNNLVISSRNVPDSCIISNDLFIRNIEESFNTWNKYPWSDNIPKDIFFNYLLPHKIYGEVVSDWRSFFSFLYQDSIQTIIKDISLNNLLNCTNEIYYRLLVKDVGKWFSYDAYPFKLTHFPGLEELMIIRNGDCHSRSYLNVYILRALGIPSTIDFIPVWGSKNSGHTTEVFWNNQKGGFRTASGRELNGATKIFRLTYKKQNIWTDSILPLIGSKKFLLKDLQHNYWLDVTHEHTPTSNLTFLFQKPVKREFAYVCVYNYGQWEPIFYGKIEKEKTVHFNNMGTNILYRVAIPENNTFRIMSNIFKLDSIGNNVYFPPNTETKIDLHLTKVNTGSRSWVKKDKKYSLYFADKNSEWQHVNTIKCCKDSILIFTDVPANCLYLLTDTEDKNRLARIFIYENGKQSFY